MPTIQFIIETTLPKRFTRKEFNIVIRQYSCTSHPNHQLHRLVKFGKIKHYRNGIYERI